MIQLTVAPHDDGARLERWLKAQYPHLTRGLLEKSIRKGWVKVDKKKPAASDKLVSGQVVMLAPYLTDSTAHISQPTIHIREHTAQDARQFREWIIAENDELIAINKPAGIAVQGGSKQHTSIDWLAKSIASDDCVPRLVHRLDKDTSGVLILAKTSKSATRLTRLFASKDIEKRYTALVVGMPRPSKGQIDMPLAKALRGKDSAMEMVDVDEDDGKEAITRYEVTHNVAQRYAWVNLYPITGRTHQLRVHMAAIGHPIVGDGKYGGAEAFQAGDNLPQQLHLHAACVTLPDSRGKELVIEAPLPPHMQQSWEWLGQ